MTRTHRLTIDGMSIRVITNARLPRMLTWCRLLPRRINDWAMRRMGKTPLPEHLRPSRAIFAFTLGNHVRLAMSAQEATGVLLAHEVCHVIQRERLGFWEYYRRYVVELLRDGYDLDHDLEREAHEYAVRNAARYAALLPYLLEAEA